MEEATLRDLRDMTRIKILNLAIDNVSMQELLDNLDRGVVFTPNADHFVQLQHDQDFLTTYDSADYRVCDSRVVCYAARFLGSPLKEKISGSDLFPAFYKHHKDHPDVTIFLLGAREGIADQARQQINADVGREMVVGTYSPPFGFEKDDAECQRIMERVNESGATVLAVGLGAPKQEKFIVKHKDSMPGVKIFLAIGATIDFEAGTLARAPRWMSELGLEWAYRLMKEPKRLWKRYLLDDPTFIWLVIQQKLNRYHCPWRSPSSDFNVAISRGKS